MVKYSHEEAASCFAHPDDESFSCGGTVAKYVKAGWEVHLLCATRGERGETGPYGKLDPETLGAYGKRSTAGCHTARHSYGFLFGLYRRDACSQNAGGHRRFCV